ncbi:MAG: AAA family ATPase [Terriglobales bacterium]
MPKPTIYLIAGCNGAGKTTFAKEFLPHEVKCLRFYNADELARGLSPFDPAAAAIKAGRLLLAEIRRSITRKETFALESTLSGTTYRRLLQQAKASGYRIYLHYLWLPTPEIAIARVRERVKKGGHDVPASDIRRRFARSLRHLVSIYAPLADRWAVWNNEGSPAKLVAESESCTTAELRSRIEQL